MELFTKLLVNWVNNPKIIAAGLEGAGLHASALCLAKQMDTNGVLHRAQLHRVGATDALIDDLVGLGLFDVVDDRRVAVHDWLDINAASEDYRAHGKRGNHVRHKHPDPFDTCTRCWPPSPPLAPEEGRDPPEISTGPPSDTPQPVDNHANGETPRSLAMPRPPERGRVGGRSGGDSPSLPEPEEETETDEEPERRHVPRANSPRGRPSPAAAATFTAAVDLLTARRILTNPTRPGGNPERHRASIHAGITRDRAPDAWAYLAKHPDTTPQQLADHLEPPPDPQLPAVPTSPWTNGNEIARRADIETEEATAARLAALRASTTQADATEALATARAALRPPTEPAPPDPAQPGVDHGRVE